MALEALVHIDQAPTQPGPLRFRNPLALRQPQQAHRFGFAVVEHRPVGIALQQGAQPSPEPLLAVLVQGQQGVVGRPSRRSQAGPAGRSPLQFQEAVQEIVAGVGIGLDVVNEHPGGLGQFGQGGAGGQPAAFPCRLHPGLGHQLGGHIAVLFAMVFQGIGQTFRIGRGQFSQAGDAQADQQVAALAADAAHFAEVPFRGGLAIAEPAPGAQGAFFAVADQWWCFSTGFQLGRQARQHLLQLLVQAGAQVELLPLQLIARPGQHQGLGHGRPLVLRQQPPPEGQHQPVLAGEVAPLPHQHRAVAVAPPATRGCDPLEQRGMGLQGQPAGAGSPQPQANHPRRSALASLLAMAGPLGQQALETAQLVLQGQGPVGAPAPGTLGAVAVEPGPPPAAQPAAQEPVGEGRGRGPCGRFRSAKGAGVVDQ